METQNKLSDLPQPITCIERVDSMNILGVTSFWSVLPWACKRTGKEIIIIINR